MDLPGRVLESDLGERIDLAAGSAKRDEDRLRERRNRREHSEKRRRRTLLLFVLPTNPGDRDQPGSVPVVLTHGVRNLARLPLSCGTLILPP